MSNPVFWEKNKKKNKKNIINLSSAENAQSMLKVKGMDTLLGVGQLCQYCFASFCKVFSYDGYFME